MLKGKRYEAFAEIYDAVELGGDGETALTNARLIECLRERRAKRVLDMACGTGAQAIALQRAGFEVVGSDLSEPMLRAARRKAGDLDIRFYEADMTRVSLGRYDAIIAINNGIGHLSPRAFEEALRNASSNLEEGGLLVFDVFNAPLVAHFPRIPIIDVAISRDAMKYVRYSSFDFDDGSKVLTIHQTTQIQEGFAPFETIEESYQLQTYDSDTLKRTVLANGFSEASVTGEGMRELFGDSGVVNFVECVK